MWAEGPSGLGARPFFFAFLNKIMHTCIGVKDVFTVTKEFFQTL